MASVEQRANDWRVVWRQDGGKQFELFPTLAGAETFKAKVEAYGNRWPYGWVKGVGEGVADSTAPTFGEWAARSIASRATANDRTRFDYQRDYDRHLADKFGTVPLDRITRELVGAWLIEFRQKVSPKTAKNVQGLASSIMADAIEQGYAALNPFKGALRALPTVKHEETTFLTRGEFETLLSRIDDHYRPLTLTLAMTGLRWSESTALRVGDVDVMARRIGVVRAWKRTPSNSFEIGEPKSRRSRRTLIIPNRLRDVLLPLVAGREATEYLFTTVQGHPVRANNYQLRTWGAAVRSMQRCKEHAAKPEPCRCPGTVSKRPRIHDLRHSHASWLIAERISLPAIQRRLGHESITTTIDRYGHLLPDIDDEISEAMDAWDLVPA